MTQSYSSLAESLVQLSHEIAGAFSIAFFELETIRTTAAEFGTDVGSLLAITATPEAQEGQESSFGVFLRNARSASVEAEKAAGSLTDRAFQGALIRISGSLLEMKKHTVALSSISSLTKITQAETRNMADRLNAFTESLDSRCRELQQATARSADLVVETQYQSGLARDRLTAVGLEFRALSDGAENDAIRLSMLEEVHHVYMSEISDEASKLDGQVRTAVAGLIGCLQFPDSFAQRSEHVCTAITAMEKAAPAERAALRKVVEAQLARMAEALTEVTTTAGQALETLQIAFDRSPIIQNRSEAADPSDAWMTATAQANEAMLDSVARARDQFGTALTLLAGLTRQINATQDNLETSVRLNRELETSVHNASLVAHRSGSQTSPLRFLAGSVKDVVDRTSDLITQISGALGHIRGTSEALAASGLDRDLETLLELQETAAQDAADQAERVGRVRETRRQLLRRADRLDGAAKAGGNSFAAAAEHAKGVAELGRRISQEVPAPDCDETDELAWLYAIYTMEEERVVHREALGLPAVEETPADTHEDLDDFML